MDEDRHSELSRIEFVFDLKCYLHPCFRVLNFKPIDIVFLRRAIVISFDNSGSNFLKPKSWMVIWKGQLHEAFLLRALLPAPGTLLEAFRAHCHIWSDTCSTTLEKVSNTTEKVNNTTWKGQLHEALLLRALSSVPFFISRAPHTLLAGFCAHCHIWNDTRSHSFHLSTLPTDDRHRQGPHSNDIPNYQWNLNADTRSMTWMTWSEENSLLRSFLHANAK